jgi:hypothetical protein
MADRKVTELSAITNLSGDDLLLIVNDPAGTPSSRKITHRNFFANVVSDVTHRGKVTTRANTFHYGTNMTIEANVNITSVLTVNNHNIVEEIDDRLQVANAAATYVTNTVYQTGIGGAASNTHVYANFTTNTAFQSYIANTNALLTGNTYVTNAYMQPLLANTNATVALKADQSTVDTSNTTLTNAVNDRLQVANAASEYTSLTTFNAALANTNNYINEKAPLGSPNFTGVVQSIDLQSNTVQVQSNGGFSLTPGGIGSIPASSNASSVGVSIGTIWFSNTHLYIATDQDTIKRVALDTF